MENKKIEKLFKPKKAFLITTIILVVTATLMGMYVEWKDSTEVIPEPVEYYDLALNYSDKENDYVKVTIKYISLFAEREDSNLKYYYIQDENSLIYIVRITDETYKKIEEAYNEQQENFSYELEGYIFDIPEDVKKLAISEIGYHFEEAPVITNENYEDYFGKTYLNENVTPSTELHGMIVGVVVMGVILAIVFGGLYIASVIKVHKYAKKLDIEDVKYEMDKSTAKHFPQEHIYLTDKYVISDVNGLLKVNEYEEFVWIYNFKAQQYGVTVNIFLTAKTKNKKELHIATSTNENKLNEIMSIIKQKNTNILVGFTPENKKEYKNICKRKE